MGLKLELFLVALIVGTSIYMMSIKLQDHNKRFQDDGKELEFYDTTFLEVNATGIVNKSYGIKGVRMHGTLYVDKFRYSDKSVVMLRSNKARDTGEKLILTGDVYLKSNEGYILKSSKAAYDKPKRLLKTGPFVAYKGSNLLRGSYLSYDMKKKYIYAAHTFAMLTVGNHTQKEVKR